MTEEAAEYKVTNLQNMREAKPSSASSVGFLDTESFELMQRVAKPLSSSSLVPQQYRGNIPNCMIALNMASRMNADPLLVMQNLYMVHGNPSWSAQFLIATFNQCGRFSAIRYEFVDKEGKDTWGCRAYATEYSTGDVIRSSLVTIALAKAEGWYGKTGSKWKTMPEQMLMYRSASFLVRAHAPELSMGMQTAEEIHDVYDASKGVDGSYGVDIDDLRQGETLDQGTGEILTSAPQDTAEPDTPAQAPDDEDVPPLAAQAEQQTEAEALQDSSPMPTLDEVLSGIESAKSIDAVNECMSVLTDIKSTIAKSDYDKAQGLCREKVKALTKGDS